MFIANLRERHGVVVEPVKREYLLRALARVVAGSPQCDFQSGEPELNEFARSVTRFAGIVQEAFTLADDAMLKDMPADQWRAFLRFHTADSASPTRARTARS